MATVTAPTGKITLNGTQRTMEAWLLRSERLRINTRLSSLAYRDGWDGFFNPADPDSFQLTNGKFSSLVDVLGNLPALLQATDANRPSVDSAYTLPVSGYAANQRLQGAVLSTAPVAQPYSVASAVRFDGAAGASGFFISLDNDATNVEISKSASSFFINAGATLFRAPVSLTGFTPIAAVFDGANSVFTNDGGAATGNAGSNPLQRITLGTAHTGFSVALTGIIGAVAIRFDNDNDAAVRMSQAIHAATLETL